MNKMLVTYVTCAGSTGEVDTNVTQVLRTAGTTVDVWPIQAMRKVKGNSL